MKVFSILSLLISIGCSCSHSYKLLDSESAVSSNDLTAIMSGCGQQLAGSGYLVCREMEGIQTRFEFLEVHTPPDLNCKEENCTFVKLFFPDGRPAIEKSIQKGASSIRISWREITNKEAFEISDRGFYAVSIIAYYSGPDALERKTYADGMIFMHVVRKEYISLIDNEEDENFYWIWKTEQNQTIKVTSGYRVYVEPQISSVDHGKGGLTALW